LRLYDGILRLYDLQPQNIPPILTCGNTTDESILRLLRLLRLSSY